MPSLETNAATGSIINGKANEVIIKCLAKPGAKVSAITGLDENHVSVAIAAPPVDGEANAELVKFMAKQLLLRKSDVSFEKGSRSRDKVLSVYGLTKEEVEQRIQKSISG